MNSSFVSHEVFRKFTNTLSSTRIYVVITTQSTVSHLNKIIINIPLNALNMFFWLITASKLLQRKSTLEKIK